MCHGPDNCLAALVHRDVFNSDGFLASSSVSLECLDLRREGAGELVEGTLRAVLLRNSLDVREPAHEGYGCVVDGGHLRREHGLQLILRLYPLDH